MVEITVRDDDHDVINIPNVKVIVWAISEKGQKCHKQTLRENKQGKIFAKENATGREGERPR